MIIKKLAFVFAFAAVIFSVYSLTSASEEGISWAELSATHPLKEKQLLEENENLQQLFLFSDSSFDSAEAYSIIQTINNLPSFMVDRLLENDVRIKLFTGNLTDNKSARHLKGEIPRGYTGSSHTWDDVPGMGGSRTVLIKIGASRKGSGHGSVNLELHEIAHTIDTIVYDRIREDENFLRIWKREAAKLFPGQPYFINHPEEYFAEVFAMFYKDNPYKSQIKDKAPETFFYIEHLK